MTAVYRDGHLHVLAERCPTCIFRPGNLMHLPPGRVAGMVAETKNTEAGNIPCHEHMDGPSPAICRGWWDRYADTVALCRLARHLGIVVETR